jgi:hypothetical protein
MRRTLWLALVLVVFAPSVAPGMGGLGGDVPSSIPTPGRDFLFTITDQEGTETQLKQFSIEGLVYLSGEHGMGTVAIPFERIKQVRLRVLGEKLHGEIDLVDGKTTELILDGRQKCYGRMEYANFKIELRDLVKMVNQGEVSK